MRVRERRRKEREKEREGERMTEREREGAGEHRRRDVWEERSTHLGSSGEENLSPLIHSQVNVR